MRILITGNGGSGKSWLAQRLAAQLALPLVHFDDVYWDGAYGGVGRDKQQVIDDIARLAQDEAWVMEGVYGWLLPAALPRATEFVFLDLPVADCIANLRQRGNQGGGSEAAFNEMLAWVAEYPARTNSNSRLAHHRLWEQFDGSKLILSDRDAVDSYLRRKTGTAMDPRRHSIPPSP